MKGSATGGRHEAETKAKTIFDLSRRCFGNRFEAYLIGTIPLVASFRFMNCDCSLRSKPKAAIREDSTSWNVDSYCDGASAYLGEKHPAAP